MPRTPAAAKAALDINCSPRFIGWLKDAGLSLAVTSSQASRLFLIGPGDGQRLSVFERVFDHATGVHATPERILLASRQQLWQLDNVLGPNALHDGYDRLYVPRIAYTTGDIDIHDVALDADERVLFVDTLYSCLATVSDRFNFTPVWRPPFISRLVPEDRCHLNGVAMADGRARYVSSIAACDEAAGWRHRRRDGGCVIDVPSGEVVAGGLSMPHSPRLYRGSLWLLNSGSGEFGRIDAASGRFDAVTFCPGYLRGLAFHENFALVTLSKPRHNRLYTGLELDQRLDSQATSACCGLRVIDLDSGNIVHTLDFEGVVNELYDVQVLTGVRRPMALGLRSDELSRVISFEDGGTAAVHKLVFTRAEASGAGKAAEQQGEDSGYRYQHTLDMSPEFALSRFRHLTFPRLDSQAQVRALTAPLAAVVATCQGQAIGLVLAVRDDSSGAAQVISWFVAPEHRRTGVGSALLRELERLLDKSGGARIELAFRADWANVAGIETILQRQGWSEPATTMLLYRGTMRDIAQADWLDRCRLPAGFVVFPWYDLTSAERQAILDKQNQAPWFPPELSPFQEEDRIEFLNSVGLRYRGEVVGWMITHRTAPDTIQYTSLFVRQDLQPLGRSLALLAEAIRRQMTSDVPRGICQVGPHSDRMARYMRRRFLPFDIGETDQRCASKNLVSAATVVPGRRRA